MPLGSVLSILMVACMIGPVLPQQDLAARSIHAAPLPSATCSGGFSVRKAETRSLKIGGKLNFQDVITNMGGWSASTNEFHAPCTGVYFFTFHAVSTQKGDFTLALMKNGEYQVTAYGSKGDYQQGSNSALLVLNVGEEVHLELQDGTIYEHPYNEAYTTFTGFLVEKF